MWKQWSRSLLIFWLALSFVGDYLRIRRIDRRYSGTDRQQAMDRVFMRSGARVRRSALRLQGLIVKVGQFLSARTDVLPLSFTRELAQLQDSVPGAPYARVAQLVEKELEGSIAELFLSFAVEPIAAASLGQVHQATLRDGRVVAVKVLRPGIERLARIDLSALRKVVWFMQRYTKTGRRMNISALYREFHAMVDQELDYRMEASNLKRFQKEAGDDARIVVPQLFEEWIKRRVLVMEFIQGAKVTDLETLSAWGVSPKAIADILIDSYLSQILRFGFVHADPHPGNMLVLADGRLCILDYGMMTELPRTDVREFAKLVAAALLRNYEGVVQAIEALGFLQPDANREFLKRAIAFMLDQLGGLELRRGPELDSFLREFQEFLREEPLVVQARYMFLGRAVGMVSGVVSALNPSIDWLSLLKDRALPMLSARAQPDATDAIPAWRKVIYDGAARIFGDSVAATTDLVLEQAQRIGLSSIRIPEQLDRVLQKADRGDLMIRLEVREVLYRLERQERIFARAIWSAMFLITGGLGLWLQHVGLIGEADFGFGLSGLFLLCVLWNSVTHARGRPPGRRR